MAAADPEPVELLGRPGCHLCDALWPEVQALAGRFGVPARSVDIEQDRSLLRAFLWRIPVVRHGGRILAEGRVDPAALDAAMARSIRDDPVARRRRRHDGRDAPTGPE